MVGKISSSLGNVARWIEEHHYEAYDPGDGNLSFLHRLTFGHLLLERILQQSVYRAPINLRPLLGIRPHRSTKGTGYIAWAYTKWYALGKQPLHQERARACFDWLMASKSPRYPQYAWGNDFVFSSRSGRIPAFEPTIVWTSLIGQAFWEGYQVFRCPAYLEVLSSICDWILGLPRESTRHGVCISYVAFRQSSIHNSNMLGAALLARAGRELGRPEALELAADAMAYSCFHQHGDGSWFYGEEPRYHWIDNFHTGYNLDCLKRYVDVTGDSRYEANLERGLRYYKENFFGSDGTPKYYHNRTYPIDIQCAAQSIDTLTFFSSRDPEVLALARKVADWTIRHMQAPDGHFFYRHFGWIINKAPMLHWGQGTMFKALVHLLARSQTSASPGALEIAARSA